jgi:hypothetical protein
MQEFAPQKYLFSRRLMAGASFLSLTLVACSPSQTPTVARPGGATTPAAQTPIVLPSQGPLPARSLRLKFKVDPALLRGFGIKQITDVAPCQTALDAVQTTLTVPGSLSTQAQSDLSTAGVQIQDLGTETVLTFSNTVAQLATDILGLNYVLADLPLGTATGQTVFKDSVGGQLGFVDYTAEVTSTAGADVTIQLRSIGTAATLAPCPQVEALVSGATLTATGGDIAAATPIPTPTPTPTPPPGPPPSITTLSVTTGAVLDPVIITGLNFTGATAVKFGNQAAFSFTIDSDTQITAQVPNGFSSGTVSVTTPNGTINSTETFTFQPYSGGARTIYVNQASAGGNGSSWGTAMNRLDTAMYMAQSGDQVWVAAGKYLPTNTTDRSKSFILQPGTSLYGGFAGTETDISQRNISANETQLSADLSNNDNYNDADFSDVEENSYHVLIGANNATVDGVTIIGGNANGPNPHDRGGGIYNNAASPILNNVTFFEDRATYVGGGIYNLNGSSPQISNFSFNGCFAQHAGGAVYNAPGATPSFSQGSIVYNSAKHGGGMFNDRSSPTFNSVVFQSNTATYFGGGMCNRNNSSPTLDQGRFENNRASLGAGMYNVDNSSPTISNYGFVINKADNGAGIFAYNGSVVNIQSSIFQGNAATYYGGGIYLYKTDGSSQLNRLTFVNNTARDGGGMAVRSNSSPNISNSMFSNNYASATGGGVHITTQAAPIFRHVTLYNNVSPTGAEIFAYIFANPTFFSTIAWNVTANKPVEAAASAKITMTNSIVNDLTGVQGSGNMTSDPNFVNHLDVDGLDNILMTADDGLRLADNSPGLAAGVSVGMPATDILGVARTSPPDIGAYQGGFTTLLQPLVIEDLVVGTGPAVVAGDTVTVNYIGTLTDTTEFDNSYTRGETFSFTLNANQVIAGWDQGLVGMQVGGKRKLTVPPHLGYGASPVGIIPAYSTLLFEIELVSIP